MRGRLIGTAVAAALLATATGSIAPCVADAAAPAIAEVGAATPLSGGGGWLVWSAQVPGGWGLMGYHDGKVTRLPVALRQQPFDASVGSDAHGAPVVVFSRCASVPRMGSVGGQGGPGGALLEPQTGAGCRVRLLDLATGRERSVPIPSRGAVSDTTPSVWRGAITFARHERAHGDVWQILTWAPRHPHRLLRLPHGRIPTCPERRHGCLRPAQGYVEALASDDAVVSFLWVVPLGEGVPGEGAWELRVDKSDGTRSALAAGDIGHEACTAPNRGPHELEYVWPEPPIAAGEQALFPELYAFSCFQGFASVLGAHGPFPAHARLGKLEAVVLALARDHGKLYGLVPPPAEMGADSPSCTTSAPCTIEQLAPPALVRQPRPPFAPLQ